MHISRLRCKRFNDGRVVLPRMCERECSLLVNLDLKVKTKLKTGEEARSASVSEWIWHNIDDDQCV